MSHSAHVERQYYSPSMDWCTHHFDETSSATKRTHFAFSRRKVKDLWHISLRMYMNVIPLHSNFLFRNKKTRLLIINTMNNHFNRHFQLLLPGAYKTKNYRILPVKRSSGKSSMDDELPHSFSFSCPVIRLTKMSLVVVETGTLSEKQWLHECLKFSVLNSNSYSTNLCLPQYPILKLWMHSENMWSSTTSYFGLVESTIFSYLLLG